jgi:hypothetical protein
MRSLVLAASFLLSAALIGGASGCKKPRGEPVGGGAAAMGVEGDFEFQAPPATSIALKWLPPTVEHWRPGLERVATEQHVDADLLAIIVLVESGGDPKAKSPSGALGLMQILPITGRHIANERKLAGHSDKRLTDPDYNLDFGAWYLGHQLVAFSAPHDQDHTVDLGAAAYNAGPGSLKKHLRDAAPLSDETQRYIRWVGGMWRERRSDRSDTYAAWWRAGGSHLVERAGDALNISVSPPLL